MSHIPPAPAGNSATRALRGASPERHGETRCQLPSFRARAYGRPLPSRRSRRGTALSVSPGLCPGPLQRLDSAARSPSWAGSALQRPTAPAAGESGGDHFLAGEALIRSRGWAARYTVGCSRTYRCSRPKVTLTARSSAAAPSTTLASRRSCRRCSRTQPHTRKFVGKRASVAGTGHDSSPGLARLAMASLMTFASGEKRCLLERS